jgi:hypothetical protein
MYTASNLKEFGKTDRYKLLVEGLNLFLEHCQIFEMAGHIQRSLSSWMTVAF